MLDQRLMACADYVRAGAKMCDIGTDHGYLPCYLAREGKIQCAIAADVNEKPLESAVRTIAEWDVTAQVTARLSDGLAGIKEDEADDIVIAGMGGELIFRIVSECSWIRNEKKRLILQPMSQVEELRENLYRAGFEILKETPVLEGGHHYTVMCCQYSGKSLEVTPLFAIVGKVPEYGGEQAKEYLHYQKQRLLLRAEGLRKSKKDRSEQAGYWEDLANQIPLV